MGLLASPPISCHRDAGLVSLPAHDAPGSSAGRTPGKPCLRGRGRGWFPSQPHHPVGISEAPHLPRVSGPLYSYGVQSSYEKVLRPAGVGVRKAKPARVQHAVTPGCLTPTYLLLLMYRISKTFLSNFRQLCHLQKTIICCPPRRTKPKSDPVASNPKGRSSRWRSLTLSRLHTVLQCLNTRE